jgi:hypothetical protein
MTSGYLFQKGKQPGPFEVETRCDVAELEVGVVWVAVRGIVAERLLLDLPMRSLFPERESTVEGDPVWVWLRAGRVGTGLGNVDPSMATGGVARLQLPLFDPFAERFCADSSRLHMVSCAVWINWTFELY